MLDTQLPVTFASLLQLSPLLLEKFKIAIASQSQYELVLVQKTTTIADTITSARTSTAWEGCCEVSSQRDLRIHRFTH